MCVCTRTNGFDKYSSISSKIKSIQNWSIFLVKCESAQRERDTHIKFGTSLQYEPALRRFIYLHHITLRATVTTTDIITNPLRHWCAPPWKIESGTAARSEEKGRAIYDTTTASKSNSKENSFWHWTHEISFVCACAKWKAASRPNENYLVA